MTIVELPDLIRVPMVARFLDCSVSQAWRLVWSGDLPSIRLSEKVVRVPRADLERWLETKRAASA